MLEIQWVENSRVNPGPIVNGQLFRQKNKANGRVCWRCVEAGWSVTAISLDREIIRIVRSTTMLSTNVMPANNSTPSVARIEYVRPHKAGFEDHEWRERKLLRENPGQKELIVAALPPFDSLKFPYIGQNNKCFLLIPNLEQSFRSPERGPKHWMAMTLFLLKRVCRIEFWFSAQLHYW